MAVTINADTSNGLILTPDTSGEIKLQSAGTDKITMTSDGNLGIGTTTPSYTAAGRTIWTLNGSTDSVWTMNYGGTVGMYAQASATDGKLYTTGSLPLLFGTGSTERMRIDAGGNVSINSTTTTSGLSAQLFVKSDNSTGRYGIGIGYGTSALQWRVMYMNSGDGTLYFHNGNNYASLSSAGAWTNASDERLKNNIVDIKYGLDTVLNTKPRSYKMNDVEGDFIGFVAQELQTVIPEVVSGDPEKQLGVDYGSLVAVAFKAIQEQQETIKALETRIQALENA